MSKSESRTFQPPAPKTPYEQSPILPQPGGQTTPTKLKKRQVAKSAIFCTIVFASVILILYLLIIMFRVAFVYLRLDFVEPPLLTKASIPYYVRPGTAISDRSVQFLSFEYFVVATDILDAIHLLYVPACILYALTCGFRSLEVFGYTIVVAVVFLLHFAKFVYFFLYAVGILSCTAFLFCVNRNPISTGPDILFWFQFYTMLALLPLDIGLLFVGKSFRSAQKTSEQLPVKLV
jgi:hypothetical protein